MTTNTPDNNLQDDQVLAKLYKKEAKDTPPAKLDNKILNYAANANKSSSENSPVGSHFGGGWKVPLSMAASVVVVFALLVQLDQSPRDIELPPIPEISIPTESNQDTAKDEALSSTATREEAKETEDALLDGEARDLIIEQEEQSPAIQNKPKAAKKNANKKLESPPQRERVYQAPLEKAESINKTIERQAQEPAGALSSDSAVTSGSITKERSMQPNSLPSHEDTLGTLDSAVDSDAKVEVNTEGEFAPLPVEDWLLMIETFIARKDYAEAARQLQKFKQAHPKVNVEDLESKIP